MQINSSSIGAASFANAHHVAPLELLNVQGTRFYKYAAPLALGKRRREVTVGDHPLKG